MSGPTARLGADVVRFGLLDRIYHKLIPDRVGFVTGIIFRPTGHFYWISWNTGSETAHFEIELTTEKPLP